MMTDLESNNVAVHVTAELPTKATCTTEGNCDTCKQVKSTKGTAELFLKSVSVWINKPHVVNRRLCGSKTVAVWRSDSRKEIDRTLKDYAEKSDVRGEHAGDVTFKDLSEESSAFTLLIRELIPKSDYFANILEAVLYDKSQVSVSFIPICENRVPESKKVKKTSELKYTVSFSQLDENFPEWAQVNEIVLSWARNHEGQDDNVQRQMTLQWLRTTLLEKLVNWSHINDISTSATSLQLVAVDKYKDVYMRLKNTYGRELVKNWTESTDPKKFVYEDVAIAAYLLLIWEEDREKKNVKQKQSFVDLGCGNGLLVYILTREGHRGLGIDLRRRKIWDTFGPGIELQEKVITPSAEHLFPDYDWIIGNHSDELTPWIPVITARSSYNCCFFLLPCCHHDFIGKYGTVEKGKSHYGSYLEYVKEIIYSCGFRPECDTLRIPSTKRICYLGRERSYSEQMEPQVDLDRQAYIDKRTTHITLMTHSRSKKRAPYVGISFLSSVAPNIESPHEEHAQQSVELRSAHNNNNNGYDTHSVSASKTAVTNGDSSVDSLLSGQSGTTEKVDDSDRKEVDADGVKSRTTSGYKRKAVESAAESCGGKGTDRERSQAQLGTAKKVKEELSFENEEANLNLVSTSCDTTSKDICGNLNISGGGKQTETGPSVRTGEESTQQMELADDKTGTSVVRTSVKTEDGGAGQWAVKFTPRVEGAVRNCQQVAQETKTRIVSAVFQKVLASDESAVASLENGKCWRKGGAVPLGDVVRLFDKATMQELKAECGGLQTLLRNHSHIFQVTGGVVRLRDFTMLDPWEGRKPKKTKSQERKVKTTLCWFFQHHPDGCPREGEKCLFAHGEGELKERCHS
ncbi:probable tRNA (uracil-O(2)-)-methyltransferase [Aplysia californica]|uniref:Probable tRNA (uracil-O(2)-)-methyltransferase n=1 Tax=Aplysia californica TaxID=6500 RepID=A0ABM0K698_APLCA|nr:probable tRNA (uracil-O(2)-)-methyltransferase [Aplysia californica]